MRYVDRVDRFRRRLLARALRLTGNDLTKASRMLDMQRAHLRTLLVRLDMLPPTMREMRALRDKAPDPLAKPRAIVTELKPLVVWQRPQPEPPKAPDPQPEPARPRKSYFGVDVSP